MMPAAASSRQRDLAMVGALLVLGVGLPLIVGAMAGSLEIPRSDDWAYRRIAIELARTGKLVLDGMTETMIVGQILLSQPFVWIGGLQPPAFTAIGILFATASILSAYALARCLVPAGDAAFAAGLLAIFPGYLAYATSFMSDVPALAAQFLCLALGALALRRRPIATGLLLMSAAAGIFAFSIREFAVAAPASVMLAVVCAEPSRRRHWALAIGIAACCASIHVWRTSLPGQLPPLPSGLESLHPSIAFLTMAFTVAPAALIGAIKWRRDMRRLDLLVGICAGAYLVAFLLIFIRDAAGDPMMSTNLESRWGAHGGYLDGPRPVLFSDAPWVVLNVMALSSVVVVLGVGTGIAGAYIRRRSSSIAAVVHRFGSPLGLVVIYVVAISSGLVIFGLSRPVFDRYLWPLVTPVAVLFLYLHPKARNRSPRARSNLVLACAAMAMATTIGAISVVYLLNSHAFGAARWRGGEQLVQAGVPTDQTDAGFEWVGYHATTPGDPRSRSVSGPFYRSWWPQLERCGLVTSDPNEPASAEMVGTVTYQLYLVTGPAETLYLYRFPRGSCPTG
jgi:4-amino-4-deoxy-L-arabinose transferase-like glycosyltransferase